VLVDKAAPVKLFTIYDGLSNWIKCGAIDLGARDFIGQKLDHHRGIVPRYSQINRPIWLD